MSSCLSPADIERYSLGHDLTESWLREVHVHLNSCQLCQSALDNESLFRDLKDVMSNSASEPNRSHLAAQILETDQKMAPIEGYQIQTEIHRGGQGVVYKALQSATKRTVAIKLLLDGAYASQSKRIRFEREIDLVAQLRHPNIVTIYDSGSSEGRAFYSMEYVEGPTLDQYVTVLSDSSFKSGGTSRSFIKSVLKLFLKIGEAVGYAHRHGVIHRDLKPGNIIVNEEGEPQILDFGLAKISELKSDSQDAQTMTGEFLGTPAYCSPEQVMGKLESIDTRSDVYSLGILLFEMLTRRFPYSVSGSFVSVANQINSATPILPSKLNKGIDNELETILLKTLAKSPEQRYQTVDQLNGDICSYLSGRPIEAKRDSKWYVFRKTIQRHWAITATVAAIVATLGVALVLSNSFYQQAILDRDLAKRANQKTAKALVEVSAQKNEAELQSYVAGLGASAGSIQLNDVAETNKRLQKTPVHLRGWEWYQFLHMLDESRTQIRNHQNKVTFAALSPDGKRVLSASADRTLRLDRVNPPHGNLNLLERPRNDPVAVNRDFSRIAIGNPKGKIRLLDVESFQVLHTFEGIGGQVTCIRFSPDGSLLAAGFAKGQMAQGKVGLVVWNLSTKELIREIPFQFWHINDIGFSNDLTRICAITFEGGSLWDLNSGQRLQKLPDRPGMENRIAFDESNRLLLTGGADGVVYGWDIQAKKNRFKLVGHRGAITDFEIGAKGQNLITSSRDKTIRIWRLSDQKVVRVLKGHTWSIKEIDVINEGRTIVSGSWDHSIRIWDGIDAPTKHLIEGAHADQINSMAYSQDGTKLATTSNDQTVKVWDAGSFQHRRTLEGHAAPVQGVAFSPNGKLLATVGWKGQAILWNAKTWQEIGRLKGHKPEARVHSVVFSGDNRWLVTGASDNSLIVWDAKSCLKIREMQGHQDHIHAVNVTADNRFVVSAGHRSIKVWSTEDFSLVHSLDRTMLQDDFSLAVHPKKNLLATGAKIGVINLWDIETGQVLGCFEGHSDEIRAVNFYPDGSRLISSSYDNTVRVWDTGSRRELLTLFGYEGHANSVLFSRDGFYAIAGLKNGDIKVWPGISAESLAEQRRSSREKNIALKLDELLE